MYKKLEIVWVILAIGFLVWFVLQNQTIHLFLALLFVYFLYLNYISKSLLLKCLSLPLTGAYLALFFQTNNGWLAFAALLFFYPTFYMFGNWVGDKLEMSSQNTEVEMQ